MYYVNKFFFNKGLVFSLTSADFLLESQQDFFFVDFLKITSFIFISCINQGQILFLSQSIDDDGYIAICMTLKFLIVQFRENFCS